MRRASAQRAGTGIQNALGAGLGVPALLGIVGVVADEIAPAQRRMFRGKRVKRRHIVILGQPAGGNFPVIAAGFQQHDGHASFGEMLIVALCCDRTSRVE